MTAALRRSRRLHTSVKGRSDCSSRVASTEHLPAQATRQDDSMSGPHVSRDSVFSRLLFGTRRAIEVLYHVMAKISPGGRAFKNKKWQVTLESHCRFTITCPEKK